MALVALGGTPLVMIGAAHRQFAPVLAALSNTTIDAANEACIMYGRIFTEDGASHTIDTTGSSSLGWRTGTTTFANAGTTVKVGLAAMDTATGPPARAANVADVITFDVSKSMVGGGGGITTTAWQEHVPDAGTKTIANGDLVAFCVQMTALGGADSVLVSSASVSAASSRPNVSNFVGAAYASNSSSPNAVITFSDGVLGFFFGGHVASIGTTTTTWNSGSATKEFGNFIQVPVPMKAYGVMFGANIGGDVDAILYSDPLGTPAVAASVSIDSNVIAAAAGDFAAYELFATPYSMLPNTAYALILKPTTANNVLFEYKTFNAAAHQKSESLGTNCYAVSRAAGAFAAVNSNKDRYAIGLLVGALDYSPQVYAGFAVTQDTGRTTARMMGY